MSVILIVVWFFVVYHMLRALWLKQLLWPEEEKKDGFGDGHDRLDNSATR